MRNGLRFTLFAMLSLGITACATRVGRMEHRYAKGQYQQVVDSVSRWDKQGQRADSDALHLVRDRSALATAEAVGTSAALTTFRETYPESTLIPDALKREYDVALTEAQGEATGAAFASYLARYPQSTHLEQVRALEEGAAFEEATVAGTAEAIEGFVATHPNSELAASAWIVVASRSTGVHLLSPKGGPVTLPAVPVEGGRFRFTGSWPTSDAFPNVVVTLPGAGKGITSQWWRLAPLWDAGGAWVIGEVAPSGERLATMLDLPPPRAAVGLLDLVLAPGQNERVARTRNPLVLPGSCVGQAHFAFVLEHPGAGSEAFPFAVDCNISISASRAATAPTAALYAAIDAADHGDLTTARSEWERATHLSGAEPLFSWLSAQTRDAKRDLLERRPATGDVLVWGRESGRPVTRWLHPADGGFVELARKEGVVVAAGSGLWTTGRTAAVIAGACPNDVLKELRRGATIPLDPGLGAVLGSVGPVVMIRTHAPEGCPAPPGPETGFTAIDLTIGKLVFIATATLAPSNPEAEVAYRAMGEAIRFDAIHVVAAQPTFTPDLTMRYQFTKPARCRTCGDNRWSEGTVSVDVTGTTPPDLAAWQATPALVRPIAATTSGWSVITAEPREMFQAFR